MSEKHNIELIGKYLIELNKETFLFVINRMSTDLKIKSECSNPCTGQGSTPFGHWEHDSHCNCIWVPEFGG